MHVEGFWLLSEAVPDRLVAASVVNTAELRLFFKMRHILFYRTIQGGAPPLVLSRVIRALSWVIRTLH